MDIIKETARLIELLNKVATLELYDFENAKWCLKEFTRLGKLTENSYSIEEYDKIKTYFELAADVKESNKKFSNWTQGKDLLYENIELIMNTPPFFE